MFVVPRQRFEVCTEGVGGVGRLDVPGQGIPWRGCDEPAGSLAIIASCLIEIISLVDQGHRCLCFSLHMHMHSWRINIHTRLFCSLVHNISLLCSYSSISSQVERGRYKINMDEWMNKWMNAWMNQWINEWTNERMIDWLINWMNEWMNEWIDCWFLTPTQPWRLYQVENEWMNEWLNEV